MLVPMKYRATKTHEIANKIVEFANSIKTSENNIVVSSIVSRKDRFNNKAEEVNENLKDKCEEHNLQLIQHDINPFRHTNAKDLHLNKNSNLEILQALLKIANICKCMWLRTYLFRSLKNIDISPENFKISRSKSQSFEFFEQ